MSVRSVLQALFSVRKCAGCGSILPPALSEQAFCTPCRRLWSEAETESCPTCAAAAVECTCMPKALSKSGAICLRKAVFYRKKTARMSPYRLILRLKDRPNRRMEGFAARELAVLVRQELRVLEVAPEEVAVTYVPRSRAALRRTGLDQSERMAAALAETLGATLVHAIGRAGRATAQKHLSTDERLRNTQGKFVSKEAEDVRDRVVILYDDVVTTGASMAACVPILQKAGARAVIALCLGQSQS